MSKRGDYTMAIGLGAAGVAGVAVLAALGRGRKSNTPKASMGFAPTEPSQLARLFSEHCEAGSLYETKRGDILLGKGPKSITWRAVRSAAQLAGFADASDQIADDTLRRCAYAALLCAAPYNHDFLTDKVGPNEYRNHEGLGLDLRAKPVLWLPMIDLDLLHGCGVIAPTHYEEDGTSTLEIPPEVRGQHHG